MLHSQQPYRSKTAALDFPFDSAQGAARGALICCRVALADNHPVVFCSAGHPEFEKVRTRYHTAH